MTNDKLAQHKLPSMSGVTNQDCSGPTRWGLDRSEIKLTTFLRNIIMMFDSYFGIQLGAGLYSLVARIRPAVHQLITVVCKVITENKIS